MFCRFRERKRAAFSTCQIPFPSLNDCCSAILKIPRAHAVAPSERCCEHVSWADYGSAASVCLKLLSSINIQGTGSWAVLSSCRFLKKGMKPSWAWFVPKALSKPLGSLKSWASLMKCFQATKPLRKQTLASKGGNQLLDKRATAIYKFWVCLHMPSGLGTFSSQYWDERRLRTMCGKQR